MIELVCRSCGTKPQPTRNIGGVWDVYSVKCENCGDVLAVECVEITHIDGIRGAKWMSNGERYLWRFSWDCGRMGYVDGLFVATQDEIDEALGREVYFGEILGKHSEIYGTLEECDLEKMDLDSEAVEKVSQLLGNTWSGYNPLDYLDEEEYDEDEDENVDD